MYAAVLPDFDTSLVVEEVERFPVGPRDVVVSPGAVEICVTDTYATQRGSLARPPTILGHSAAGVVTEVGSEVSKVRAGDRVVVAGTPACGDCFWCQRGQGHMCREIFSLEPRRYVAGRTDGSRLTADGGVGTYAEQLLIREFGVVPIDSTLPDEHLCVLSCGLSSGVGAVRNIARTVPGDTVAIFGGGRIGCWITQGAKLAGAERIIVVEPKAERRDRAAKVGATDLIDPAAGDPVAAIKDLTDGRGADSAFEAVGGAPTVHIVQQAFAATRRGGVVVPLGMTDFAATVALPVNELAMGGREIRSCQYGNVNLHRDLPAFAGLLESGRLDAASMIDRTFPLTQVNHALDAVRNEEVVTAILLPNAQ